MNCCGEGGVIPWSSPSGRRFQGSPDEGRRFNIWKEYRNYLRTQEFLKLNSRYRNRPAEPNSQVLSSGFKHFQDVFGESFFNFCVPRDGLRHFSDWILIPIMPLSVTDQDATDFFNLFD
jgi:hypothetical protein